MDNNNNTDFLSEVFPDKRVEFVIDGDLLIITCLDKNLDNEDLITQWGKGIEKLLEENPNKNVIINFQNVDMITSSALRNLVRFYYKIREYGCIVGLSHLNEDIRDVLSMTCLDSLFKIGKNDAELIERFRLWNKE